MIRPGLEPVTARQAARSRASVTPSSSAIGISGRSRR